MTLRAQRRSYRYYNFIVFHPELHRFTPLQCELPCGRSRLSVCLNGDPGVQTVEKKSKVTYHLAQEPHP